MVRLRSFVATCTVFLLAGCGALQQRKPSVVPVSAVINSVKDELQFVADHAPPLSKAAGPGAICAGPGNMSSIVLKPQKVKVTLKTVATKEVDPSIGLINPIGVLSIDPSYSGAYSKSQTQSIEIDLGFPQKSKNASTLSVTAAQMNEHPLAQAIIASAKELLNVDHTKQPCLIPTALQAVATFDVVNTTTGGLNINLWVFKLGDKIIATDEFHQTMELDFDLVGSTALIPP